MRDRLPSRRGSARSSYPGRAPVTLFGVTLLLIATCTPPWVAGPGRTTAVTFVSTGPEPPRGAAVSPAVALKVVVSANPSSVSLGDTSILSVSVSGGTPWFKYNWTALPLGCVNQNTSTLTCKPTEKGGFSVRITVTDSTGRTASNSTVLQVAAPSSGNPFFGTNAYTLYVFAALVGVVAAALTALILVRARRRRPPGARPIVAVAESAYIPPHTEEDSAEPR